MTMPSAEYRSDYELTNSAPYIDLTDKLWSVFSEYFSENILCYKDI